MGKKTFLVMIFLVGLVFFVSTLHGQGSKKTITLPNGEVVWDLNGEWNALYEHYGPMQWVGNIKGMLMIIQQGNTFVAKTTADSAYSAKGTEKIRGELDKEGIKKARYSRPDAGWVDAKGEISKDCDKIVFDDGSGVKVIIERK
jgi:hypothetical protein